MEDEDCSETQVTTIERAVVSLDQPRRRLFIPVRRGESVHDRVVRAILGKAEHSPEIAGAALPRRRAIQRAVAPLHQSPRMKRAVPLVYDETAQDLVAAAVVVEPEHLPQIVRAAIMRRPVERPIPSLQ